MDYSSLFVCLMGLCTVFIGLICIIALVTVMSAVVRKTEKKGLAPAVSSPVAPAPSDVTPELVAAVSAAIAEELGSDINAIRIVSMKKV